MRREVNGINLPIVCGHVDRATNRNRYILWLIRERNTDDFRALERIIHRNGVGRDPELIAAGASDVRGHCRHRHARNGTIGLNGQRDVAGIHIDAGNRWAIWGRDKDSVEIGIQGQQRWMTGDMHRADSLSGFSRKHRKLTQLRLRYVEETPIQAKLHFKGRTIYVDRTRYLLSGNINYRDTALATGYIGEVRCSPIGIC